MVTWRFSNGLVLAPVGSGPEIGFAPCRAFTALMAPELREGVRTWIWDLELNQRFPKARTAPIYTFLAVEGGGS